MLKFKEQDVKFHLGSGAHSLQEIGNFSMISDLIAIVQDDVRNSRSSSSSSNRYHSIS